MGFTTPQFLAFLRRTIKFTFTRENSAETLLSMLEKFARDYFNKATDTLPINQVEGLEETLAGFGFGNNARFPYKVVRYATEADRIDNNGTSRDSIAEKWLCLGTICDAEFAATPELKKTVLVYDPDNTASNPMVFLDGLFQGAKIRGKWVAVTSSDGFRNFSPFDPEGYRDGEVVTYQIGPNKEFFEAVHAFVFADYPNGYPAPALVQGSSDWQPVSPPNALYQPFVRLSYEALVYAASDEGIVPGKLYEVYNRTNGKPNLFVTFDAVSPTAAEYARLAGSPGLYRYSVATDTTTPITAQGGTGGNTGTGGGGNIFWYGGQAGIIVPTDGAFQVPLPTGTTGVLSITKMVQVERWGTVYDEPIPVAPTNIQFNTTSFMLTVTADADLKANQKLFIVYFKNAEQGTGGGSPIVDFTITGTYPNQKINIVTAAETKTADAVNIGSFNFVPFTDFVGSTPITFPKETVIYDIFNKQLLRAKRNLTIQAPNYPSIGNDWELIPIATNAKIAEIEARFATIPGKMPRYHNAHVNATMVSGETLTVSALLGSYSGRVEVHGNGSGAVTSRLSYGNYLQGNGYSENLNGAQFDFARDATIADWNLSNGTLLLYGTLGHQFNNGSLSNIAVIGGGGQTLNLVGTSITCSDGFVLFRDAGMQINLYGTRSNPNPTFPANAGADVAGVSRNIIPYSEAVQVTFVNEVTQTQSVELNTSDLNSSQVLSSSDPLGFTLKLPANPGAQKLTFTIRVADSAIGLFTIDGNSKLINGEPTRKLAAGESRELLWNGTAWRKIGGVVKPLRAKINGSGAGNIAIVADQLVPVELPVITDASILAMATTTVNSITIFRKGLYQVSASSMANLTAPCSEIDLIITVNDLHAENRARTSILSSPGLGGVLYYLQPQLSKTMILNSGERVGIKMYCPAAYSIDNRSGAPPYIPELEVIEQNPW